MNTPQKILTVVAIAVFVFVTVVLPWNDPDQWQWGKWEPEMTLLTSGSGLALSPFGLQLLVLSVVYVGLFFILKGKPK
jgi:hypothetical protein